MKDINISITSIENSVLEMVDEKNEAKRSLLESDEVKHQLMNYLFGDGENPFEEINKVFENKYLNLQNKITETSAIEKVNYLGQTKRGVNFVKKLKTF
jgi:hypothetical protein